MSLNAILERETGEVRKLITAPPGMRAFLPSPDDERFRCIGFVDDNGYTLFNWLQMPTLMKELQRLAPGLMVLSSFEDETLL
jgi:hypothetical protein